jgi:hypothetical protein
MAQAVGFAEARGRLIQDLNLTTLRMKGQAGDDKKIFYDLRLNKRERRWRICMF